MGMWEKKHIFNFFFLLILWVFDIDLLAYCISVGPVFNHNNIPNTYKSKVINYYDLGLRWWGSRHSIVEPRRTWSEAWPLTARRFSYHSTHSLCAIIGINIIRHGHNIDICSRDIIIPSLWSSLIVKYRSLAIFAIWKRDAPPPLVRSTVCCYDASR